MLSFDEAIQLRSRVVTNPEEYDRPWYLVYNSTEKYLRWVTSRSLNEEVKMEIPLAEDRIDEVSVEGEIRQIRLSLGAKDRDSLVALGYRNYREEFDSYMNMAFPDNMSEEGSPFREPAQMFKKLYSDIFSCLLLYDEEDLKPKQIMNIPNKYLDLLGSLLGYRVPAEIVSSADDVRKLYSRLWEVFRHRGSASGYQFIEGWFGEIVVYYEEGVVYVLRVSEEVSPYDDLDLWDLVSYIGQIVVFGWVSVAVREYAYAAIAPTMYAIAGKPLVVMGSVTNYPKGESLIDSEFSREIPYGGVSELINVICPYGWGEGGKRT